MVKPVVTAVPVIAILNGTLQVAAIGILQVGAAKDAVEHDVEARKPRVAVFP